MRTYTYAHVRTYVRVHVRVRKSIPNKRKNLPKVAQGEIN